MDATLSPQLSQWLQQQGFDLNDLNSRIDNGMTPLMQAAVTGETEIARELLQAGVEINLSNNDDNNALWFSCFSENLDIFQLLVEHGIEVDHSNENGATALIYAASAGKLAMVKALVAAGASLEHSTLDGFGVMDSAATLDVLKFLRQAQKNQQTS